MHRNPSEEIKNHSYRNDTPKNGAFAASRETRMVSIVWSKQP